MSNPNKKLRRLVGIRLQGLSDLLVNINRLDAQINNLWDTQGPDEDGNVTQEACEAMAALYKQMHQEVRSFDAGHLIVHEDMALQLPSGANEGGKCWPPESSEC